jgi:hypothetical protein
LSTRISTIPVNKNKQYLKFRLFQTSIGKVATIDLDCDMKRSRSLRILIVADEDLYLYDEAKRAALAYADQTPEPLCF